MPQRRYVILDRDGTVIKHRHYLTRPEDVELIPGVAAGLRTLMNLPLGLLLVTNQSVVGRGKLTEAGLEAIHDRLRDLLAAEGVRIDGIYVCPHQPEDDCACRKPKTGLVDRAARELGFSPRESFLVGDNTCDIALGSACGAVTFFFRTPYGAPEGADCPLTPDFAATDFDTVVSGITRLVTGEASGSERV